ncbi:TIM barrel protein [Streptomyces qaidamensis]|uniref:TIM barrel protein n=1 Tax=Streptomyces qaidamensis TaxID=1783515 RepID=UPI002FFB14B8
MVEGDLTSTVRRDLATGRVGHLQIAGVPDRNEPDRGELSVRHLLDVVDELGFDGWTGCEYNPRAGTSEGLRWLYGYRSHRGSEGHRCGSIRRRSQHLVGPDGAVSAASQPSLDTTSELRAGNGQITRRLRAGPRRTLMERDSRTIHATGAGPFEHRARERSIR